MWQLRLRKINWHIHNFKTSNDFVCEKIKMNFQMKEWIYSLGMIATITNKPRSFWKLKHKRCAFLPGNFYNGCFQLANDPPPCHDSDTHFFHLGVLPSPRPWSHLYPAGTRGERQHRKGIMTSEKALAHQASLPTFPLLRTNHMATSRCRSVLGNKAPGQPAASQWQLHSIYTRGNIISPLYTFQSMLSVGQMIASLNMMDFIYFP